MFLLAAILHGQQPIGDQEPAVKVMATATKNTIMLRWGVTTPTAWKYANQYGFTIERKTITRAGQILPNPEVKMLVGIPLKPKPMMEWETFTQTNMNAAVAAQAIYGEDFEIDMENGGNDIVSVINRASALEQRFSFALFAADQDFEVAKFSGLGYVDTTVVQGEQYLYTIKSKIPTERLAVQSAGVYIGLMDFQPLPKPLDFVGTFNDKSVMLSWNYSLLKRHYTNYIVERSDDKGNTFSPLDDIPVANMSEREKDPSDRMFYMDSIAQNNKEYQYRIKGISAFGKIGPPSEIAKGMGTKPLGHNPAITATQLSQDEQTATLTWEFPEEGMETLSHFELHRSHKLKGDYQVLISDISKTKRTLEVRQLEGINYFTITAVGVHGTKRVSFPQMVQLTDAIPPAIPTELTGSIDSTGVVQLQWKKNIENDFLGYRIFRANLENEEFTQITFQPISKNTFVDTVKVKVLNHKIYYKIQAFDKRYNPSEFSEVLMLKKPDLIPPTQPVFKSFKTANAKVQLHWITSSSEDAVKTLIYRKEKGVQAPWQLAGAIPIVKRSFEDTGVSSGVTYLYTMVTIDESGLESKPIVPMTITLPKGKTPEIDKLNAYVNAQERSIRISWKQNPSQVVEYSLFKGGEDQKMTLYKIFDRATNTFVDTKLKINTAYTYGIQALFKNGSKSLIKTITIEY